MRVDPVRDVDDGDADRDVPDEEAPLRREQEPGVGQYSVGRCPDGDVHLLDVHDNRRPIHPRQAHGARAGDGPRERGADNVPDNLHPGRVQAVRGNGEADPKEARAGDRHVPPRHESGHVGDQHPGEVEGGVASGPAALLRPLGVDHHHPRLDAVGDILQVPQHRLLVRGLEKSVQGEAYIHVT